MFCEILLVTSIAGEARMASAEETVESLLAKSRGVLAQIEGELKAPGLKEPVEILRDKWGIAHIYAKNSHDLFFAQGYVIAQERLWQMDMTRRYASGDLAEIFGPDFVAIDREQRILGLRPVAEKAVAAMDPVQRAQFQAYANGVNAYIAELGDDIVADVLASGRVGLVDRSRHGEAHLTEIEATLVRTP